MPKELAEGHLWASCSLEGAEQWEEEKGPWHQEEALPPPSLAVPPAPSVDKACHCAWMFIFSLCKFSLSSGFFSCLSYFLPFTHFELILLFLFWFLQAAYQIL